MRKKTGEPVVMTPYNLMSLVFGFENVILPTARMGKKLDNSPRNINNIVASPIKNQETIEKFYLCIQIAIWGVGQKLPT